MTLSECLNYADQTQNRLRKGPILLRSEYPLIKCDDRSFWGLDSPPPPKLIMVSILDKIQASNLTSIFNFQFTFFHSKAINCLSIKRLFLNAGMQELERRKVGPMYLIS